MLGHDILTGPWFPPPVPPISRATTNGSFVLFNFISAIVLSFKNNSYRNWLKSQEENVKKDERSRMRIKENHE
jgi:hypothetical protein